MTIKLPKLPSAAEIRDAIGRRRSEISELKEMLRIAELRELQRAINPKARRVKAVRRDC